MPVRWLTALPVFNEVATVGAVLDEVDRYSPDVLVIDDGSTDGTREYLAARDDVRVIRHPINQGYGAALRSAFQFAIERNYDVVVTIDCDGQHEPQRIPRFAAACGTADIVSGSRYLQPFPGDSEPPAQRRWINQQLTAELNRRLGFRLTDAFCGFKAYRVDALRALELTERGYAMPLELWVQAAHHGLKVIELPVPLIYLDESRSFGGSLDNATTRLQYYHLVLDRSMAAVGGDSSRIALSACGDGVG
jgi:dolichol-phosphate mannosyltransferase